MEQLNSIFTFFQNNWQLVYDRSFQYGCVAGIILFILVIVILKLILIFFKNSEKKCKGIEGSDQNGDVFVSALALSDLVKSLEPQFSSLNILRTQLFKNGKTYIMRLTAELSDPQEGFDRLISSAKEKILAACKENLGIGSIEKIDVDLRRYKG